MVIPRRNAPIAHNKFIVRAGRGPDGAPAAEQVWTGSTNLSEGGIYGHSNVGHVVRDSSIAGSYLTYWAQLADDPHHGDIAAWIDANNPFSPASPAPASMRAVFSPRTDLTPLSWYATTFTDPQRTGHITFPFGMDNKHFEPAVAALTPRGPLRFVMLNKPDDHQDTWSADPSIVLTVGAEGQHNELVRWADEHLTGFNPNVPYLHTKILLSGILDQHPVVISGSANFSENSTVGNDENMVLIADDQDVADVYFTEYMRIFDHFYARYWAAKLSNPTTTSDAVTHSFLTEDTSWQTTYWNPASPKSHERTTFINTFTPSP